MKSYFKSVAVQITAILLAAGGAAAIAFIQSVAVQTGACTTPAMSPQEVGLLGAMFKAAHSSLALGGIIHRT